MDPELESQELEEGGEPEQEGVDEPKLLAGKFKSAEELERAYIEAQSAMTKAQQKAAELEQQRQTTDYNPPAPPVGDDFKTQFNEQFWDNPHDVMNNIVASLTQNIQQTTREQRSAIKRAIATHKSDSMYNKVSEDFEAELEALDAGQLRNERIVESIYDAVVGRHARKMAASARENPGEREALLRGLGVTQPQAETKPGKYDHIDGKDRAMLAALGLKGKDMDEVIKAYAEGGEEDE